mgnify:CR=1 FL=1|tara:strand:+ start:145 stop:1125 length:981 start_codon:yes stop_codon:yes gene_type:complete
MKPILPHLAASLIFLALGTTPLTAQTATNTAIAAAQWADGVSITLNDDSFTYQSDGTPSHAVGAQYIVPNDGVMPPFGDNSDDDFHIVDGAELIRKTPIDVTITTQPVLGDAATQTSLGMIGVTLSGARLFNDYEDMSRANVALDDNRFSGDAAFVDTCNAHPLQDGSSYHYHGVPTCITETVDVAGNHSTLIGVLLDGFPVYGNAGANGTPVTNADLDICSGHIGATPEFPAGIYHYHLTTDAAPYSVDCYRGVLAPGVTSQDGGARGGGQGPDFAATAAQLGITQAALVTALGDARPVDLGVAAAALGITPATLRAAMPPPPDP